MHLNKYGIALLRIVGFLEGFSYIFLIFLAVPLKYLMGNDQYVKMLGMPHGILFMLYIIICVLIQVYSVKQGYKWKRKIFLIILIASVIPFGTFYVDQKYIK